MGFCCGVNGTADPSTTLRSGRDDKGEWGASIQHPLVAERTADPSTTLRSGQDDTGERDASIQRPLVSQATAGPSAPVGMTRVGLRFQEELASG